MKATYNLKGIILSRSAFRERDSKITIYSLEKGRIELVVRGTFKVDSKLSGHIEALNLSSIMAVRGKSFDYAGTVFCENAYAFIRKDYFKIILANRIFKLILKEIKENEVDEEIFHLLKNFLDVLNLENIIINDIDFYYYVFLFKFLDKLGYSPNLDFKFSQKNKIKYFSLESSSFVENPKVIDKYTIGIEDKLINLLILVKKIDFKDLFNSNFSLRDKKEFKKVVSLFYRYNFS